MIVYLLRQHPDSQLQAVGGFFSEPSKSICIKPCKRLCHIFSRDQRSIDLLRFNRLVL